MTCRRGVTLAGVAVIIVLCGSLLATINLGRFLDVTESPTPADVIVVLGGEGARFMRTRHAVALYAKGMAPEIVFSGGTLLSAGIACTSAALSVEMAEDLGLPQEDVVLAPEAQSTLDEALNLRSLVAEQKWNSLIIVTDRFHTRRALQTLRSHLPGVKIQISAPADPVFDVARWWQNERSLVFVVNEMFKLGFYWIQYGIPPISQG